MDYICRGGPDSNKNITNKHADSTFIAHFLSLSHLQSAILVMFLLSMIIHRVFCKPVAGHKHKHSEHISSDKQGRQKNNNNNHAQAPFAIYTINLH